MTDSSKPIMLSEWIRGIGLELPAGYEDREMSHSLLHTQAYFRKLIVALEKNERFDYSFEFNEKFNAETYVKLDNIYQAKLPRAYLAAGTAFADSKLHPEVVSLVEKISAEMRIDSPRILLFESDIIYAEAAIQPYGKDIIYLSEATLNLPDEALKTFLKHEIFHLRSQQNPTASDAEDIDEERSADYVAMNYGKDPVSGMQLYAAIYRRTKEFIENFGPAISAIKESVANSCINEFGLEIMTEELERYSRIPTMKEHLYREKSDHVSLLDRFIDSTRLLRKPNTYSIPQRAQEWSAYNR